MKSFIFLAATILLSCAHAQYEAGYVKILEDQRYQNGATFGNFRDQEDGIKYKEETDVHGVRRGFWEYPDITTGQIQRVEFEAGPGIGFRIVSSNIVASTPQQAAKQPTLAAPLPVQRQSRPVQTQPKPVQTQPRPVQQLPAQVRQIPVAVQPTPQPIPANIFDYPADLQFFRDATGHRFKFSAV